MSMHLIFISLILRSAAAIFAKQAALTSIGNGLYGIIINIWLIAELIVLFIQALAWSLVLRKVALSIAYPFMSLAFGLNLLAAWLIFDEKVSSNQIIGIVFIIFGVLIMSFSEQS